ncbi:MAG: DUF362 domain-containing protein [Chloroflexi bacterium]|nr:DUF362 domain-containing protein [Chloroflexota bacterium]
MTRVTRRQFIGWTAAQLMAAAAFLEACRRVETASPAPAPPPDPTQPPPTRPPQATPAATAPPPPPASQPTAAPAASRPPAGYPDLVVVRNGSPEQMVQRALATLGGIERFVHRGDDVIVKPNLCVSHQTYEYAATTNPWVVGALVKLSLEAGAGRVRVMDMPNSGTAEEAYVRSGIREQVEAAGGQMEFMSTLKYVSAEIPEGKDLRRMEFYDDVLKADVVINVPIAKHHQLARLALGMKNLMGTLRKGPRGQIHSNFGQRIADITSRIRPALTVVDAVRILTANGPSGGNLNDVKKLDTIIASPDIVAADSYAATLFGLQPDDVPYIKAAAAMGLGRSDLRSLNVEEINFA